MSEWHLSTHKVSPGIHCCLRLLRCRVTKGCVVVQHLVRNIWLRYMQNETHKMAAAGEMLTTSIIIQHMVTNFEY